MACSFDIACSGILTVLGGRQAVRTIHCAACFSFVGFILIHVFQVMVTGWFTIKHEGVGHEAWTCN
ncbi:hypothetical protein ACYX34_00200 [Nitrospira sp. CMX1]|nr:hypothetical protein [Nitrospira sp.]MBS0166164.1 hypothetical protein [Nitrospira sp.]